MGLEKVLRRTGGGQVSEPSDDRRGSEGELNGQLVALRVEIDRSTSRSTVGLMLAGITLAGLIGISYQVGMELGGLRARVGQVESRLERVETRLDGLETILRGIDERTRRMEASRRATGAPDAPVTPVGRAEARPPDSPGGRWHEG